MFSLNKWIIIEPNSINHVINFEDNNGVDNKID